MPLLKKSFLYIPFYIIVIAFCLDKIIILDSVSAYFSKTLSELNYQHKPYLFDELKDYLKQKDRKKVLVYFGNSRALLFDNLYISRNYPDWILFNFSVPGGTPDYFLYWLERFKSEAIHPDFILIDHSLEVYNKKPKIQLDEVLIHGVSLPFVLKYYSRYSSKEIKNVISKRFFKTYQYRPKWKTAKGRIRDNYKGLNEFKKLRGEIRTRLKLERGSALPLEERNKKNAIEDIKRMERLAMGNFNSYINPYIYSYEMEAMQRDVIYSIKEQQIPFALIWVKVSKPYFNLYKTKKFQVQDRQMQTTYEKWISQTNQLVNSQKIHFWNMNEDTGYKCEDFSDPGHMSPTCYPSYTDYIFSKMAEVL